MFAQWRNLLSPSYPWMLRDILTFNTRGIEDHAAGKLASLTLGDYFAWRKFAPRLFTDYLVPMGAAIRDLAAGRSNDYSSGTLSARGPDPAPHNGTLV